MRNVHQRELPVPAHVVGPYLDRLGGADDVLWPAPAWPAMRLDQPLRVGSAGGHAEIRYTVSDHDPGHRVALTFDPGVGLVGTHALAVHPLGPEGCVLRHEMSGRLTGSMRLLWPLVVRWLHDAVLEDLLDNAERATTGTVRTPYRWSRWVRLLRFLDQPRTRAVPFPAASRVARSLPRVDYADAFQLRVPVGITVDAEEWFAAGFTPPWDMAMREPGSSETVGGGHTRFFDYRAAILVAADERRASVTIASVVQFHSGLGRLYFTLIKPGHRLAARAVLRRAARRLVAVDREAVPA